MKKTSDFSTYTVLKDRIYSETTNSFLKLEFSKFIWMAI